MIRLVRFLLATCALGLGVGLVLGADEPTEKEIKGHEALVYSVAFSPDGRTLATAGFDNLVKLWDYPSFKERGKLTGHTGAVYCVTYSKDGQLLATSSLDKTIRLWNAADGKFLRELKGHADIVDSVAFSPDGKLLASASADKSVRLWNPGDGKEVKNLGSHAKSVYAVAFSPDGKLLASAGADNLIKLYDVPGQKELKQLKGHTEPVTGVLFTPDGNQVVSISQDRLIHIWDVKPGSEPKKRFSPPMADLWLTGTQPPPARPSMVALHVTRISQSADEPLKLGPTEDDLYGLAFSRDGRFLATSGYAGYVHVWDLAAGKAIFSKKLKTFGAYCINFTPDGKALVTGHDNRSVLVTPIGK